MNFSGKYLSINGVQVCIEYNKCDDELNWNGPYKVAARQVQSLFSRRPKYHKRFVCFFFSFWNKECESRRLKEYTKETNHRLIRRCTTQRTQKKMWQKCNNNGNYSDFHEVNKILSIARLRRQKMKTTTQKKRWRVIIIEIISTFYMINKTLFVYSELGIAVILAPTWSRSPLICIDLSQTTGALSLQSSRHDTKQQINVWRSVNYHLGRQ